jgi:signal peptidase I
LSLVRRYAVEGRSMLRAYAPGDRLLVEAVSYRLRRPRIGEVVVVRQPADGRLDLKRIVAGTGATVMINAEERVLGHDEWYVLGDNLSESQDSRTLGPVKTRDIVGRVWLRY